MPKNIIICSDGTGNTAIKGRGTNVFKLFEAVDLNGHRTDSNATPQVALYDDGVGTDGFLLLKLFGGAFGWGLKRNVLKLYTGLVRIYDPGDRIYLFGFSRGAFTVRTLAGIIAKCGVLNWEQTRTTDAMRSAVGEAYDTYRRGYRTWLWRMIHRKSIEDVQKSADEAMANFKTAQHAHEADIHFVGVWDTVDSVGGPFHMSDVINTIFYRFKFSDHKLSKRVHYAAQALSIDDSRAAFEPLLWEADERIEQVWFAGVHSNVGGGYPKQGMSLVALDWMLQKAHEKGLRVLSDDRKLYREHGSVDDKLYDSRAGLGVFYRWKPRNMEEIWRRHHAGSAPWVHLSVLERIAHGTDGYAPGTLAPDVHVVYTPTGDRAQDKTVETRAQALQSAYVQAFRQRAADLAQVSGTLLLGRIAYYLYLASCLAAVLAVFGVATSGWQLNFWYAVGILPMGFAIAAALAARVQSRRSLVFSRFWHESRHELREAMKTARQTLQSQEPASAPVSAHETTAQTPLSQAARSSG